MKPIVMALLLVPSLSMAAHPLVSDDRGTQGANKWQYELNTDHALYEQGGTRRTVDFVNTTLTYGLGDTVDIAANIPYSRTSSAGLPVSSGIDDASLILKWRFYEKDGVSLALKPQINFATGNEEKGLGNGKTGAGLNGLLTLTSGQWTLLGNLGATLNRNDIDDRSGLWNISLAVLYSVSGEWKIILDNGVYRNPDRSSNTNPAFTTLGVIWSPSQKLDVDFGYKVGLNSFEVKHSVGVGLTMHFE